MTTVYSSSRSKKRLEEHLGQRFGPAYLGQVAFGAGGLCTRSLQPGSRRRMMLIAPKLRWESSGNAQPAQDLPGRPLMNYLSIYECLRPSVSAGVCATGQITLISASKSRDIRKI